ncbi:MAG: RNA polymerase sigma factor [Solobacterium sp.]|nr:RNA polymerase sigma factor [Solobacterium sp.]
MNNEEFKSIYSKFYRPLYLYALSLTHHKEDAEDLVSETMVKAFLSYSGKGNIQAWMFKTLKNTFLNQIQKEKRVIHGEEELWTLLSGNQYHMNELLKQEEEQKQWLYRKIYQLPERERNVIILTVNSGLKDEEIAELLNLTVSNLRVIRHRAVNTLKKMSREDN